MVLFQETELVKQMQVVGQLWRMSRVLRCALIVCKSSREASCSQGYCEYVFVYAAIALFKLIASIRTDQYFISAMFIGALIAKTLITCLSYFRTADADVTIDTNTTARMTAQAGCRHSLSLFVYLFHGVT